MAVGVLSLGSYAPSRVVTSSEVAQWCGATTDWIHDRTGVLERRYAADDEATSDLAAKALSEALSATSKLPEQLSLLVVATCTPDQTQPAAAVHTQRKAEVGTCGAFDVNAVCSGFVYALVTAAGILQQEGPDAIGACIGADKFSALLDRRDKKTAPLFGDGAGCVVLGHVPDGYGLIGYNLLADGRTADLVTVPAGGSALPASEATLCSGEHYFKMNGRGVKEFALTTVPSVVEEALCRAGVSIDDIDRAIIHQGNVRLVESLAAALGIQLSKVEITGDRLGNTAAASVPMTLAASDRRSPLQRDELVLLVCVGGGMTSGAAVLRWH